MPLDVADILKKNNLPPDTAYSVVDTPEPFLPLTWKHFPGGRSIRYKVYYGGRNGAKCLAVGTRIIMADGSLRAIEDVCIGESVLGPDSAPRSVLATTRSSGMLYRIKQSAAMDYVVNADHVLSLRKHTHRYPNWPEITNIPLQDWLEQSVSWRNRFCGYRAGALKFPARTVAIDPYSLGIWLGDGTSRELSLTTADSEIAEAWTDFAESIGGRVSVWGVRGKAQLLGITGLPYGFSRGAKSPWVLYGLMQPVGDNRLSPISLKHIPEDYLLNSEEVRLQILAGLIDTDGHLSSVERSNWRSNYRIAQVNGRLAADIKRLADGLGFRTSIKLRLTSCNGVVGNAWYVSICGDISRIPCRLPHKRVTPPKSQRDHLISRIAIEPIGIGEYAGITLDGDHLFMLEDGTVTHNSWQFARALVMEAFTEKHLILCTRQFQNSIADSVYRVVEKQIDLLGLRPWFKFTETNIGCPSTGSEFIFKGLQRNINEIRSLEGVTRCWIEEAHSTKEAHWIILDPTIRGAGAQIWISYNPDLPDDYIHRVFVNPETRPNNAVVRKVSWRDNPWFSTEMEELRQFHLKHDQRNYSWIWEGETRNNTEAMVYWGKVHVETFEEAPPKTRFYHGLDFGFGVDPSVLIRCYIMPSEDGKGEDLFIDREAYANHVEIDEMPDWMERNVPDCRRWPIKADNARPETISYLSRKGFQVSAAEKWPGSVEDGIAHLRGFRRLVIHERYCPNVAKDFLTYTYKVDDKKSPPEVLPILVDRNDHGPDAVRYALDGMIQARGGLGVWLRLVKPNR